MKTQFDRYEISHVAEYASDRKGFTYCDPLNCRPLEEAQKLAGRANHFWTLYGHLKGEEYRITEITDGEPNTTPDVNDFTEEA